VTTEPVVKPDGAPLSLLVLCTGNAARSVMAGFMIEHLAETNGLAVSVITGGTHTLDGQPMGMRTRAALMSIDELAGVTTSRHRSRQVRAGDVAGADLVVVMEADHVRFIRRHHPEAAGRTATLRRLVRDLPPRTEPLPARLDALGLGEVELADDEDVTDPAGHEEPFYIACAREIWDLCADLVDRL
jgi:protein-tyrosine-phosphatase